MQYQHIDTSKYGEPKSHCTCGHSGDGANSDHYDSFQLGHGRCKIPGCKCGHFTWAGFYPEFEAWYQEQKKLQGII